jgi:pilus assembly protein CpaB
VSERKVNARMDRRRLLLILAVFVAVIGTALVFVYVRGADNRAKQNVANIKVLQATQNVAAGETFDSALSSGKISLQDVPRNVAEANTGYQTSVNALKGKFASVPIFAGQVIVSSQFSSTSQINAASPLAIPKGMIAISVNLTDPDRVAGNILDGSRVAIFVTDAGGPEKAFIPSSGTSGNTPAFETALLLPNVQVLNVGSPVPVTSTTTDTTGTETTETLPRTLLTLAVTQKEAQKIIFSSKHATLTFGLLTPQSKIKSIPGTVYKNLFK